MCDADDEPDEPSFKYMSFFQIFHCASWLKMAFGTCMCIYICLHGCELGFEESLYVTVCVCMCARL